MDPQPPKPLNEQYLARIKSRRWVALLLVAGTVVIALASFTDAARKLLSIVSRPDPIVARQELAKISMPYTPDGFLTAVRKADVTAVKLYLAAGMSADAAHDLPGKAPTTVLIEAASAGHAEVVGLLLDAKADPNRRSEYGYTPLAAAAYAGHVDIVRALLARKADTTSVNQAFVSAAGGGEREALKLLRDRGADLGAVGQEALLAAARQNRRREAAMVEAVEFLLQAGVDPKARDAKSGSTALHLAAYHGEVGVTAALLKVGADPHALDRDGATPLWWAAGVGRREHAALLLAHGADPNARDKDGMSVLDRAKHNDDKEMVRMLVERGAR